MLNAQPDQFLTQGVNSARPVRSDLDHLTDTSTEIPVAILRRALPRRFARIDHAVAAMKKCVVASSANDVFAHYTRAPGTTPKPTMSPKRPVDICADTFIFN